jgi:hypothetical protein
LTPTEPTPRWDAAIHSAIHPYTPHNTCSAIDLKFEIQGPGPVPAHTLCCLLIMVRQLKPCSLLLTQPQGVEPLNSRASIEQRLYLADNNLKACHRQLNHTVQSSSAPPAPTHIRLHAGCITEGIGKIGVQSASQVKVSSIGPIKTPHTHIRGSSCLAR